MDKNTVEWEEEQSRIDFITRLLSEKRQQIINDNQTAKEDIQQLRKGFWDDVTVNIDEPDEVIETYASIKQQAELLAERERSYGQFDKLVDQYGRQQHSPYFGRIDFVEDGKKESIYIGIGSLMDRKKEDFLIYDWRAPISSMYYDYSPGPARYETPEGEIEGEMELKRQFIIREGLLKGMFDTGVTIGDELLQQALGSNASAQMRGIVATIQKEQNKIIRYKQNKILMVQGVAGSGKTSAAMQRIAYLLYRDRKSITADQILLFSPNHMFMSYVSSVLPELGEENMRQMTFQEYAAGRVEHEFKVETPFEQLEYLLDHTEDRWYSDREKGIQLKAAVALKDQLDAYVKRLEDKGMLFKNITFRGRKIVSADAIKGSFYRSSGSIPNRVESVKNWLLSKLDELEAEERTKDWPEEEAAFLSKEDYLHTYKELQSHQNFDEETFDDFEREQELLTKLVVQRAMHPLRKKVANLKFIQMKKLYHQFYEIVKSNGEEHWYGVADYTQAAIEKNQLYAEDITPYLYLKDQIEGRRVNTDIRHVFVDEAQDYSPFQMKYIQQLFPNARFNLLGDYNQAIHTLFSDVPSVLEAKEVNEDTERIQLMRSYRSTKPIVEFTKPMIPGGEKIEAFNREGNKPRLHKISSDAVAEVEKTVNERLKEGYETVAVLTRTKKDAINLYDQLKNTIEARLIYKESQTFEKGVLVLPAYLAKGIEFDAVIIPDASDKTYYREEERKLFYTACTRAMHELDIFYQKEKSHFLEQIPEDLYQKI
ncbi:RNA polymerase recycling motor HelD [Halobacillus mangrovi]|uniref:Helicase n=1 Tax=Halobacillus mangrovi TaxID=402384 RepID=A0A1W5ZY64_9BACI|nr:RNA polymerase recycling motor HelD [Halobacillus mangrovi]ARI78203.1 helicase [Halobacillus mangrovi]